MIEADWLCCDDPLRMLEFLMANDREASISVRKLLLFAETGCNECQRILSGAVVTAWDKAEYVAGASCGSRAEKAVILRDICGNPFRPRFYWTDKEHEWTTNLTGAWKRFLPKRWLTWDDHLIPRLAQAIYEERAFDRMPILADALQEAGCTNKDILWHCNGWDRPCRKCEAHEPFPHEPQCDSYGILRPMHVRGCWLLDLLLGKE